MGVTKSFFRRLDEEENFATEEGRSNVVRFLSEVKSYVKSGDFTEYKKADQVLMYWGKPDTYVSSKINMKESTVRVARRNLSKELFAMFGDDFFDLIHTGDIKNLRNCSRRFNVIKRKEKAIYYFSESLLDYIKDNGNLKEFDLKECQPELSFLVKHCSPAIRSEARALDFDKLLFLVRMVDRRVGSKEDLYSFLDIMDRYDRENIRKVTEEEVF